MPDWNQKRLSKLEQITSDRWADQLWMVSLTVIALVLLFLGLGNVALRDWDEGIVAQVAREIWRSQTGQSSDVLTWLYPSIHGTPYLNKPTLVHWLIAQCFAIGGVNEWTARFPGAMLTAFSVPVLYGIGREIFVRRTPAIFAGLVYVTLLPIMRHGRLAMLDGALVCFFLVMLWCLLRSRRDMRWALGVGIGFGLMCLTKGAAGLLLGAIALIFIAWDTPRLLTSGYLWLGMMLGSAPVLAWYWAQWLRYKDLFWGANVVGQSFGRIWNSVEGNTGPVWFYLIEIAKYTLPWLVFFPQGVKLAWGNRNLGWAKLLLIWSGGYLLVISLMQTKLPWYVMPMYPVLALIAGAILAEIWEPGDVIGFRYLPRARFPVAWSVIFGGVAIAGWIISVYLTMIKPDLMPGLGVILAAISLSLTLVTILILRRDSQFILVLLWGMYMSLVMLMASPYWLWELQESFPVKPVAALIQQGIPSGQLVAMSYPTSRPSLNFYSDRIVISATEFYAQRNMSLSQTNAIARYWKEMPQPYVLVDQATFQKLSLPAVRKLGATDEWLLITRDVLAGTHSQKTN